MPIYLHALFTVRPTQLELASYQSFAFAFGMLMMLTAVAVTESKKGMLAAGARSPASASLVPAQITAREIKPNLLNHSATEVMHKIAADLAPQWLRRAVLTDLSRRNIALFIADALCEDHEIQFRLQLGSSNFCDFQPGYMSPYNLLHNAPPHSVKLRTSKHDKLDGAGLTDKLNHDHGDSGVEIKLAAIACMFKCTPSLVRTILSKKKYSTLQHDLLVELAARRKNTPN